MLPDHPTYSVVKHSVTFIVSDIQWNFNNVCYKVYIKPDLTPKQVEESKNLVTELKRIREQDLTRKWKIHRGRITEITEQNENTELES